MGKREMKVSLLRYTGAPQELVVTAARVCYSPGHIEEIAAHSEAAGEWIEKLSRKGHLSPLEHASFTFGIEGVSRSLLAQLTRHRIASFSVQSQRYVGMTGGQEEVFGYIVPPAIAALGPGYEAEFARQMYQVQKWYDYWVEKLGGGKSSYEDARYVLPNAAETRLVVTMNARELLHFFKLRLCLRAQWEIRALAGVMLDLVREAAGHLFAYAGPACVTGPCPEGEMGCGEIGAVRSRYGRGR